MKKYKYRGNCYSLENVRTVSLCGNEITILYFDGYSSTIKLGNVTEGTRYAIFDEIYEKL